MTLMDCKTSSQSIFTYCLSRLHKAKPKEGPKSIASESETSENIDDEIMAELEELMGPDMEGGSAVGKIGENFAVLCDDSVL